MIAASVAVLGATGSARAQNFIWNGGNDNYNSGANWSGAGTPPPDVAGETAAFTGGGNASITVTGTVSPNSWAISGGTAYTISGGTVGFSAGAGLTSTATISQIVGTQLSGVGAVQQNGSATLTLTNTTNNYTGSTTITAGQLIAAGTGTLGAIGNSVTVNGPTAVLNLGGASHGLAGGVTLQGGGAIHNGTLISSGIFDMQAGNVTASLAGTGSVIKSTAGTVTFSGANIYLLGTTITAGTLQLTGAGTLGGGGATTISGGFLNLGGTTQTVTALSQSGGTVQNGTMNVASYQLTGGTLAANATVNTTFIPINAFDMQAGAVNGMLAGLGSVSKTTAGTVIFLGANTYTGGTTISAGSLLLNGAGTLGSTANTTTISGGFLNLGGTTQTQGALSQSGGTVQNGTMNVFGYQLTGGTLETSATVNTTFNTINAFDMQAGTVNGVLAGAGWVSKTTPGTVTFAGANTYTGNTQITDGTLALTGAGILGNIANSIIVNGATAILDLGGTTQFKDGILQLISGTVQNGTLSSSNHFSLSSGTISAALAGTAGLSKAGPGTLILSGANTYSGSTSIFFGTLQAGMANTLPGSTAVTVAGGATLAMNGFAQSIGSLTGAGNVTTGGAALTTGNNNTSTTFSGGIDGAGSLVKAGSGTFTLSGANTYTGATTVNAGTLMVNGSIASAVTVNNGGTLGGIGTTGGVTVNSGGTLSPGNSIGVLNINGNLVLGAGAIYVVEVAPASADFTNVTGTAQLGGTVQLMFGLGAYAMRNYTILTAAGGRSGTFDSVQTFNLPPALQATLSYTSTDVLLVTLNSAIAPLIIGTPNQEAVAAAQDAAFNSGLPSITALFGLSATQLPGALDQLSGEVHASTAGVLVDESLYARSAILGRLRQASYGGNSSMAALSMGGPQVAFAEGGEAIESALGYAKSPIVRKAPAAAPRQTPDVVFWAQGFGAWGRFNGDGNAASVRRDLAGFFTGIDTSVAGNGRVGIAAGYTGTKNNLDGRGSSSVETSHIAGYGGWNFGAFNLRAGGDFAFHSIATDRTILFPGFFDRTFANYDGHTGQVFGELGYGFALANIAVEPFAGAAWVRVKTDAAAERGGAAALNFAGTTFETGYATLGIRAASMITLGDSMILIPRASLAWQHAFDGITPNAVLAFQVAPAIPFTISGVPIARDSLLAEAGLDLAIGRNATVGVSYTGQIARNVTDHAAKGKFSWKF